MVASLGETVSNLILTPLTASSMVLDLDSSAMDPSMVYLAFFGTSTTVAPTSIPEVPDSVMSEPTPMVVEVNTKREPVASVRMLALKPAVENCELIESRTCCSVAPAGTLRSYFLPDCEIVRVVGEEPLFTTDDAPPTKVLVDSFEALAN
ncbi:hypothetical protein D3C85_821050 [compost metagenome]